MRKLNISSETLKLISEKFDMPIDEKVESLGNDRYAIEIADDTFDDLCDLLPEGEHDDDFLIKNGLKIIN